MALIQTLKALALFLAIIALLILIIIGIELIIGLAKGLWDSNLSESEDCDNIKEKPTGGTSQENTFKD